MGHEAKSLTRPELDVFLLQSTYRVFLWLLVREREFLFIFCMTAFTNKQIFRFVCYA